MLKVLLLDGDLFQRKNKQLQVPLLTPFLLKRNINDQSRKDKKITIATSIIIPVLSQNLRQFYYLVT